MQRAREDGIRAVFGDGTQPAVLEHVGIADARVIVFAISSPADELRGVELARMLNPSARIIVRTRYVRAIDRLMAHGATEVVVEEFEASLELFARALESYEIPLNRIWRELESLRSEHYAVLRDADPGGLKLDALKHLGIHDALELWRSRTARPRSTKTLGPSISVDGRAPSRWPWFETDSLSIVATPTSTIRRVTRR